MALLKKFIFLVILFVCTTNCTANDNNNDTDLEDEMELRMERDGQRVTLRLKKNDNVRDDVPVFTTKDDVVQKLDTMEMPRFKAYQDLDNMASIIITEDQDNVRTRSLKTRSYSGTFNLAGRPYVLRPVARALPPKTRRGTGRVIRTVDLGDVTEMSHEAERELREMTDDTSMETKIKILPEFLPEFNEKQRNANVEPRITLSERSATEFHVEMAIFVDSVLYKRFSDEADGGNEAEKERNAESNIRLYFSHVANGVNMRYETIKNGNIKIDVKLVSIYIAKRDSDSPFTTDQSKTWTDNNGETFTLATEARQGFRTWYDRNKAKFLPFDQATIFTGNRMKKNRTDTRGIIIGQAGIKGICKDKFESSSINKDGGLYASTQTAAHELGHNLGIKDHDNQGNALRCPERDQYVMAPNALKLDNNNFANTFRFSSCSIQQLKDYLTNSQNDVKCLKNAAQNSNAVNDSLKKQPGQEFTLNEQCQHIYGSTSHYCEGHDNNQKMCREMVCHDPDKDRCLREDEIYEIRAFDGTTCKENHWCMEGRCVPRNNEECKDKNSWCPGHLSQYPGSCYQDYYQTQCCKSCKDHRIGSPGCEYRDAFTWCNQGYCDDPELKKKCCYSCRKKT